MIYWTRKKATTYIPRATRRTCMHGAPHDHACYACDVGHPDEWYRRKIPDCEHRIVRTSDGERYCASCAILIDSLPSF